MDMITLKDAIQILENSCHEKDFLNKIYAIIENFEINTKSALEEIKKDIENILENVFSLFPKHTDNLNIKYALHCVVYNIIYPYIFNIIKEENKENDLILFNKTTNLSKHNISTLQLGSKEDYGTSFTPAVTELSNIENYKSPLEKLNCIFTSYELLYAELKAILVKMISKYSDKDNEIPVINDNEIIPFILMVITKSKPIYLFSNISYIQSCLPIYIKENQQHKLTILKQFLKASKNLILIKEEDILKGNQCDKLENHIEGNQYMEFCQQFDQKGLPSFLNEKRLEYNGQIDKCLSENINVTK